MLVDDDPAALVERDAGLLEAEARGVGPAADGDEHDIGLERLGVAAGGRLDRDLERLAGGIDRGDLARQAEGDALLGEEALGLLRHLAVHAGQDAVEELDDGHLAAEPPPDRAELEADDAGADDDQPLRHRGQRQRAGRGDDALLVDRRRPEAASNSEPVAMTIAFASTSRLDAVVLGDHRTLPGPAIGAGAAEASRSCSS